MEQDELKAVSLEEQTGRIHRAFWAQFCEPEYNEDDEYIPRPSLLDIYDEYAIVCKPDGTYWRVGYTLTADAVTFTPEAEWEAVEKEWIAAKGLDTLVFMGSAVKALGSGKVGGYVVLFGTPDEADFVGEYFTKSTDFVFEDGASAPVYYNHGLDPVVKRRVIGKGTMKHDDAGVWYEAQLEMRNDYDQAIYKLAEQGKLGWSSGTAPHLVERKPAGKGKFEITRWPLGLDNTLTPTPMDWRNQAVPLKSLPIKALEIDDEPEAVTPEAVVTTTAGTAGKSEVTVRVVVDQNDQRKTHTREVKAMPENNQDTQAAPEAPVTDNGYNARFDALEATTKAANDRIEKLLDHLEKEQPAMKGGVSFPGSATKAEPKETLGDWLLNVRVAGGNGQKALEAERRLAETYGSVKSMAEDLGSTGGYSVPEGFRPRLMLASQRASRIVAEVNRVPVSEPSGVVPVLDITRVPTAGNGDVAQAGGLVYTGRAEGSSYTETQAYFEQIRYQVNSESLEVQATIELASDADGIETLLTTLFGASISSKIERHILRGTGAGQPLGILNAPAAIGIAPDTDNTFVLADAAEMDSRFLQNDGAKPFWLMHNSMKTDLAAIQVSAGGAAYIQNVQTGTLEMPLLSYPIIFSQHLPQANNSGCAILADLNAYMLFEKGGLSVFYSEHTRRTAGKVAWYVDYRMDGQPWLSAAVTDASPQGSFTSSPFVYLND